MLQSRRDSLSENIYFAGLIVLAASLPLSMFMMSVAQFMLAAAWLLGGRYKDKLNGFLTNKTAVVFSLIFFLRIIGLFYTSDLTYGIHDLKITLPLFVLPFIISGMPQLSRQRFNTVLWFFILSVTAGALINSIALAGLIDTPENYRGSLFISHIRFSLMICLAIFMLVHLVINHRAKPGLTIIMVPLLLYLAVFLFMIKSITGIVLLLACIVISLMYFAFNSFQKKSRIALLLAAAFILIIPTTYLTLSIHRFYDIKEDAVPIDAFSAHGEKYEHNLSDRQMEEGHYTWRYIAWNELEHSWNRRSAIPFKGHDKSGNPIFSTLIRFLTSKGLRKDADGVNQLTPVEIEAIENGAATIRQMDGLSLDDRIYEIIWETHNYFNGVNPQGHSVAQRFEFWKTGWEIFKQHPIIGVGTGGTRNAYKAQYEQSQSRLSEEHRLRAHSQYLTTLISFGIAGLIVFMIAMFYPFFSERKQSDFLYLIFLSIVALSMLHEDTFETQAGVTFVAFFNSLLLLEKTKATNASKQNSPQHNASGQIQA